MANQLLDVAPNDLITSTRQNTINDMIDDGSLPINTSYLEIGGTSTISDTRQISGNTLTLAQTATSGASLSITRNLIALNTTSPMLTISQQNIGDDQDVVTISQAGVGGILNLTASSASTTDAIILSNAGSGRDIDAGDWYVESDGQSSFYEIHIEGLPFVDSGRNIEASSLNIASGNALITNAGLGTFTGVVSGVLDIGPTGAFDMNSGLATISTDGDADFQSLSIDGNPVYQPDGFFAPTVLLDPISPTNGQIWYNSTQDALKIRIGGVTRILQTG